MKKKVMAVMEVRCYYTKTHTHFLYLLDNNFLGHVIFKVEPGLRSLNKINSYYEAENGESGRSYKMQGILKLN